MQSRTDLLCDWRLWIILHDMLAVNSNVMIGCTYLLIKYILQQINKRSSGAGCLGLCGSILLVSSCPKDVFPHLCLGLGRLFPLWPPSLWINFRLLPRRVLILLLFMYLSILYLDPGTAFIWCISLHLRQYEVRVLPPDPANFDRIVVSVTVIE